MRPCVLDPRGKRAGRSPALCALASAAAVLLAGMACPAAAAYYESADVTASAGGDFLSLRDGELNSGNGAVAQVAHGENRWPTTPDGNSGGFVVDARAAMGSLAGSATLTVDRGISGVFAISPDAEVRAQASFRDEWTISGQPFDSIGRLRLTTHFDGSAGVGSVAAVSQAFGRYELDIASLGEFNNPVDLADYDSGRQDRQVNDTATLELDFRYGRPILLNATLFALVSIDAPPSTIFSGSGHVSFGNTARLTQLEVRGANGVFSTDVQLQTLSGGLYPFMSPVPEAGSGWLMLGGLAAVGALWRRAGRTTGR